MSEHSLQTLLYCIILALPFLSYILPRILQGVSLLVFGLAAPILLIEISLRNGFRTDDLTWTPPDATKADSEFDYAHNAISEKHPYGFNDTITTPLKEPGTFRLVILGDSVIWGDGLPDEDRWSRKFQKKLNQDGRIFKFYIGDQLNFLNQHAREWQIDYLILSYISNDPDMRLIPQKHIMWNSFAIPRHMAHAFPYAARFIFGYLTQFINERVPGWGYDYWELELYNDSNLQKYKIVVKKLKDVIDGLNIPTSVVFVPASWLPYFSEIFERVIPIFQDAGFKTYNLYPEVYARTSHYPLPMLRANRADGHPGKIMTEAYADLVARKLDELYFDASGKKLP